MQPLLLRINKSLLTINSLTGFTETQNVRKPVLCFTSMWTIERYNIDVHIITRRQKSSVRHQAGAQQWNTTWNSCNTRHLHMKQLRATVFQRLQPSRRSGWGCHNWFKFWQFFRYHFKFQPIPQLSVNFADHRSQLSVQTRSSSKILRYEFYFLISSWCLEICLNTVFLV